jgi:hypothetical protein
MFAGVLSVGKVSFTEDIPTACTNGRDVIYNPEVGIALILAPLVLKHFSKQQQIQALLAGGRCQ